MSELEKRDNKQHSTPRKASGSGLDENLAGLLCYLLGFITGIIFLIIDKDNRFVKFHALQSIITFGALFVINLVLSYIPIIGWLLSLIISPIMLILWIVLMLKAYQGQMFKLPIVGDVAEAQMK